MYMYHAVTKSLPFVLPIALAVSVRSKSKVVCKVNQCIRVMGVAVRKLLRINAILPKLYRESGAARHPAASVLAPAHQTVGAINVIVTALPF
jgi:hypothetical protein